MNANTIVILIAIGLVSGIFSGIIGIGGGIIIIPALIYFVGFGQHEATGTSLAILLPPIGLFAAYNYYKAGFINIKFAFIIALAFMAGSYLSSRISVQMPENIIRKFFSIIVIFIAVKMFFTH
ncbi:MAG: permease [Bacteroidetes bacterium HGW-Bacteroidetes-6]|jgi:hypothetical protein|nr:MAG: permease [Bacteroidetes bacterium HGW-Bacteroidetes-6]